MNIICSYDCIDDVDYVNDHDGTGDYVDDNEIVIYKKELQSNSTGDNYLKHLF